MGHLARRQGFAADHVRLVELVTAEGEITTVTAESDPELFWAIRGGQGSFGIVTALEFDLGPVPEFFGGAMIFPADAIKDVLHAFSAWAPTMPEEVTTSVALLRLPPADDVPPPLRGVVSLAVRFGFTGPRARGEALLAPMRAVATPLLDSIGPMSYAEVDRIHMDPREPLPAVVRGGLLHSMPAELIEALLAVAGPGVDIPLAVVEMRLMGGALSRPAAVPNAVAGREGAFSLVTIAPAPPPLMDAAHAATSAVLDALEPWSTGTSLLNFEHPEPHVQGSAWTQDVLDRLRAVKAKVDPHNVFGGAVVVPEFVTEFVPEFVTAGAR
jgi:FAD/FMN-containing dehydrogenase